MYPSRRTFLLGSAAVLGSMALAACSSGGASATVVRAGSTGQSYPNGIREGTS